MTVIDGEESVSGLPKGPALFAVSRDQIKHRDRVRDLAEVYTHEREVTAMLDFVPDMFPSHEDAGNHDRTFLEPACGSGNFLDEILRRKLCTVTSSRYGTGEKFEHRVLRCVASIYGIDVDQENVLEARERLRQVVMGHIDGDPNALPPTDGLRHALDAILDTNVIRADSLADAEKIELVSYVPGRGGTFIREWSTLEEPESQLDLFAVMTGESQKDQIPIHYTQLSDNPNPSVWKQGKR